MIGKWERWSLEEGWCEGILTSIDGCEGGGYVLKYMTAYMTASFTLCPHWV